MPGRTGWTGAGRTKPSPRAGLRAVGPDAHADCLLGAATPQDDRHTFGMPRPASISSHGGISPDVGTGTGNSVAV